MKKCIICLEYTNKGVKTTTGHRIPYCDIHLKEYENSFVQPHEVEYIEFNEPLTPIQKYYIERKKKHDNTL